MQDAGFLYTLTNLDEAARYVIENAGAQHLWCFFGEMGAGKTTLIKAICHELGVKDDVSSPTFSLVNEYKQGGKSIYHFDFYRIKDLAEVYDIGYEDYFATGNICLIEWPEKIAEILEGETYYAIEITLAGTQRNVSVSVLNTRLA